MGENILENNGRAQTPRVPAPRPQPACFACGASHPNGLKLQFHFLKGEHRRRTYVGIPVLKWTPE